MERDVASAGIDNLSVLSEPIILTLTSGATNEKCRSLDGGRKYPKRKNMHDSKQKGQREDCSHLCLCCSAKTQTSLINTATLHSVYSSQNHWVLKMMHTR